MTTQTQNEIREEFIAKLAAILDNEGIDCLRVANNQIAFPVVAGDEEGYIRLTIAIPRGERVTGGYIPYDGYLEAENYKTEQELKAIADKEKEEKKQKKISKDKARREQEQNIEKK